MSYPLPSSTPENLNAILILYSYLVRAQKCNADPPRVDVGKTTLPDHLYTMGSRVEFEIQLRDCIGLPPTQRHGTACIRYWNFGMHFGAALIPIPSA